MAKKAVAKDLMKDVRTAWNQSTSAWRSMGSSLADLAKAEGILLNRLGRAGAAWTRKTASEFRASKKGVEKVRKVAAQPRVKPRQHEESREKHAAAKSAPAATPH
jgi:hypothetical protein